MKKIVVFLLLVAMLISITACSANDKKSETRTVIDSAGDTVEIPTEVKTVINCVTYGCQAMIGLGLGDYLIGINEDTIESPWIAEMYPRINEIPHYAFEESAESLLKANADVVFVQEPEIARDLRSKGVTALTFSYFTIDEVKNTISMLGDVLGDPAKEKCSEYISYLEGNIKRVADALEGKVDKESLYYINGVSNKGLYKTAGNGSTNCECADLSYTIFATAGLIDSPANKVDAEAILAVNPENIIIGGAYQHVLFDELMQTPEWSTNTAVKNGDVYLVPIGISAWNRYGIELALMIPWTSSVVYPETFNFDAVQETIDFYSKFTGYSLTKQQAEYIINGLTPTGEIEIAE